MNRNDGVQYSFRLNLKNPDHLLVHETLMDLDLDIHKSKSMFIIDSLVKTIKGLRPDQLTKSAKSLYDYRMEYVTRGELEDMKLVLEKDVTRDVSKDLLSVLITALSGMKGQITVAPSSREDVPQGISEKDRKETEAALSELSDMWSDDD
jgi:hypothetical protein